MGPFRGRTGELLAITGRRPPSLQATEFFALLDTLRAAGDRRPPTTRGGNFKDPPASAYLRLSAVPGGPPFAGGRRPLPAGHICGGQRRRQAVPGRLNRVRGFGRRRSRSDGESMADARACRHRFTPERPWPGDGQALKGGPHATEAEPGDQENHNPRCGGDRRFCSTKPTKQTVSP